jgi:hypothetical protein
MNQTCSLKKSHNVTTETAALPCAYGAWQKDKTHDKGRTAEN